jgi:anthranilate phosphoribosyltransferase
MPERARGEFSGGNLYNRLTCGNPRRLRMLGQPHPFARFVRLLGRGKTLSRALTIEEAEQAMAMILAGETLPEQLGAFLMLLRIKEETGEEIAGFIRAARAALPPSDAPSVDLDWPAYAGKKRQLPWFLLAALLMAQAGWRVAMHGLDGVTEGRLYVGETLAQLGVPLASDLAEAAEHLGRRNFAYLSLERLSPELARMMALKPILGLRSPVNSVVRGLDPFSASTSLQAVFHPSYVAIHRDAALLLGDNRTIVFRGDGGENERRPNKACDTVLVSDGVVEELRWPPMGDPRQTPDELMRVEQLAEVWRGASDEYGEAAVVGTVAIVLYAMGIAGDPVEAEARAGRLWSERDRGRFAAA